MTEKPQGVKNRIVNAAWQLFYEKGYNDTTVDEIIERSHTSKGSFYYYFKSKDELLNSLSDILDEYYEELEQKMDESMDSFSKLLFLNYEAHKMMEDHMRLDILASLYSSQLVSLGFRNLLDQNRKYYKLIQSVMEDGIAKGELNDDMSASEMTRYYSMCERALISDWCLNNGSQSLRSYSERYMPMMLEHFKKKN